MQRNSELEALVQDIRSTGGGGASTSGNALSFMPTSAESGTGTGGTTTASSSSNASGSFGHGMDDASPAQQMDTGAFSPSQFSGWGMMPKEEDMDEN